MNRQTSTLISLGISFALIAAGILFLYNCYYHIGYGGGARMMMHPMAMRGDGLGIILIIFWVVLIAAIILLVSGVLARRRFLDENGGRPLSDSDALKILRQRYASGEISELEYENMRKDLK